MSTQSLHRGRLIDHIQLVVKDLAAAKRFYAAAFEALEIPMGGEGDNYFWADELFISTADSTPMATTSRRCSTARRVAARRR